MRFRRFAGLNGIELALMTFIGVVSGIYIWRPVFTTENVDLRTEVKTENSDQNQE